VHSPAVFESPKFALLPTRAGMDLHNRRQARDVAFVRFIFMLAYIRDKNDILGRL